MAYREECLHDVVPALYLLCAVLTPSVAIGSPVVLLAGIVKLIDVPHFSSRELCWRR